MFNSELLKAARFYNERQLRAEETALEKAGFVDGPTAAGAGAGGAGAAPADPAAQGGGDPSMAGGGGGGAGIDPGMVQAMVQQAVQQAMATQGGAPGAAGAAGPAGIKPKIDVNVEIMQIKKMLAMVCDNLGIHIPATDMTATTQDLTQMAQNPGSTPAPSAIPPIQPMQAASPDMAGATKAGSFDVYDQPIRRTVSRAAAIASILRAQNRVN